MSKQTYRQAQRVKPIGFEGIEACRRIMKEGYAKVNEVMVDSFSASAIIAVYDALNTPNRLKLESLTVGKAATVCFKLINQQKTA